jgi:HSP20 family protein
MQQEDFDLTIENNVITLRGERRFEKTDESDNYHRVERSYGTFTRSFTLPQTVSADEAKAEYNNGVLRVTLPKREEAKSRRIQVTGESGTSTKKIETKTESSKAKASSGS